MLFAAALPALSLLASGALAQDYQNHNLTRRLNNGLGRTPALGWNSWNAGGCNAATASMALNTANLFVSLGLKDLGYQYVNIDDCWSTKSRDSSGNLVPDPAKWPNGIKNVVDQVHAKGLKFGLYGCAGTLTCGGYPGSQGHEKQDAQLIASWGVDYWKHDNCYTPCNQGSVQTCGSPIGSTQTWYGTMRDAIVSVQSTHNILFSLCNWGRDNVWTWGANYGNSWRMSVDVWNDWASIVRVGSAASGIYQYSAPYGFNDLDMLQCGNGVLNDAECRTQFGLWAISKSPLIIGTDLSKVSSTVLGIFKNKLLISMNQDSLGKAATYFRPSGSAAPVSGQLYPYWAGALSDGVVVAFTNAGSATATYSTSFADVPGLGAGTWSWTEAYSGQTGSGTSLSASVGSHDTKVFKIVKSGTVTTGGTPSSTKTTASPTSTAGCSALYGQCGGQNWTGPTCCSSGTCKYSNDYYSQCL